MTELLGMLFKALLFLILWAMFARMFYLNEVECAPEDQVSDLDTVKLLAVIWPLWGFGLIIAIAARALCWFILNTVLFVTYSITYFRNRKPSCLKN